jgi:hypothetical protein
MRQPRPRGDVTSFDVLRSEDRRLKQLFSTIRDEYQQVEVVTGRSEAALVDLRYSYGNKAKQVLYRLAVRQSAATDVARAISRHAPLLSTSEQMVRNCTRCRSLINRLRILALSYETTDLVTDCREFSMRMFRLIDMAEAAIDWELGNAIPLIEETLCRAAKVASFRDARYVMRHAPTRLNPAGPRWYEHAPIISRFLTLFDHFTEVQLGAYEGE